MANDDRVKLLRVLVIQDGRFVEERLIRKHGEVSIGQGSKNTFIVPNPALPKSYTLFEPRASHEYSLVFERGMEGRIDLGTGGEPMNLAELARTKHASKKGSQYRVPLTHKARGKVIFGNVTVLFQLVDAPPVMPRPQLPAAARGGISSHLEWPLVYILVVTCLLLGGSGAGLDLWWTQTGQYLQRQYDRRGDRLYEMLRAEVRLERERRQEEQKEEAPSEDKTEAVAEAEVPVEAPPEPEPPPRVERTPQRAPPQTAQQRETTRERMTERVRRSTILHVLGSEGGDDSGPLATLSQGVHAQNLANAFNTDAGVDDATAGGSFVGGPSAAAQDGSRYRALSADDTGGDRIATTTVQRDPAEARKEIRVRANVRDGQVSGQTGTGQIDASSVARVFQRRRGAIRGCYEAVLKVNPNVRGRITIRFTIGPAGRITDINASENTTGDTSIARCIVDRVRGWRFDPPSGGSVTFSYPFVLDTK